MALILEFKDVELPSDISNPLFQTNDGAIFYSKPNANDTIFLDHESLPFDSKLRFRKLPDECNFSESQGYYNSLFIPTLTGKIHRVSFDPPGSSGCRINYMKGLVQDKQLVGNVVVRRTDKGDRKACRIWEDPTTKEIDVDISEEALAANGIRTIGKIKLIGSHKKTLIYFNEVENATANATRISTNTVVLTESTPFAFLYSPSDHSVYAFIATISSIIALNHSTVEFVTFNARSIKIRRILGHNAATLTVSGQENGANVVKTVALPVELFAEDKRIPVQSGIQYFQSTDQDNPPRSKFDAEFRVEKKLGSGSCGDVFKVINILDRCNYAVKKVNIHPRAEEQALAEVRILAKLDHPGIVRYYDSWIEKEDDEIKNAYMRAVLHSFLHIQMDLCKYSLSQWLSSNNTNRDIEKMKMWFVQIVSAVEYMHDNGFIHRDLKPSNILFARDDRLKVCDMGISTTVVKENGREMTVTRTQLVGTSLYYAPEQTHFIVRCNSKVDIFALGLILAEMCIPMTNDERKKIFDKYRSGKRNRLFQNQTLLADLIKQLTRKNSKKRPECKEILEHPFLIVEKS